MDVVHQHQYVEVLVWTGLPAELGVDALASDQPEGDAYIKQ
jgi:hypothetical protein